MRSRCNRTALPLVVLMAVGLANTASGRTVYVNGATGSDSFDGHCQTPNGSCGPKKTIQAGIDAVLVADTVQVADGTYTGPGNRNLNLPRGSITLRSEGGNSTCIIDCEHVEPGITISFTTPGATAAIDGITIRNAAGAGIEMTGDGSVAVSTCLVENCSDTGLINVTTVEDCTVQQNLGGGVRGAASVLRSKILNNVSASSGGGVSASSTVADCIIAGNISGLNGGGLADADSVLNCTVVGNLAVFYGGGICSSSGSPLIENCIVRENTAGVGTNLAFPCLADCGIAYVGYSNVSGGKSEAFVGSGAALSWGLGNLDADPVFSSDDYHLGAGSPCIDAGNNLAVIDASDAAGVQRIVDDPRTIDTGIVFPPFVDMGAYEFHNPEICAADLNGSGSVDLVDIAILLGNFGATNATHEQGDVNDDFSVDLLDLAALLAVYGASCF